VLRLMFAVAVVACVLWILMFRNQSAIASDSPGDSKHELKHGGRTRTYEVHLPPQYDLKTPLPIVINMHGGGGNAAAHRKQTKMDAAADRYGFIVIYPEGTAGLGHFYTWNAGLCCGYSVKWKIDDVGFISKVLDEVEKNYTVDNRRVYATGMSNGAMMAYRLACELPNRITAVCGIATTLGVDGPAPTRPIPLLQIHGLKDQNAPFNGGVGSNAISKVTHKSVRDVIALWCDVNHCEKKPVETKETDDYIFERYAPAPSVEGAPIELYMLREGGHTWPGGVDVTPLLGTGKLVSTFDADSVMWNFFKRFQLDPVSQNTPSK
jgi:polyhydroxybutyrate depolymerase